MDYQTIVDFYKLVKEECFEEYPIFYTFFENNWLSLESAEDSKFKFNLWTFNGKCKFKGNKKIKL